MRRWVAALGAACAVIALAGCQRQPAPDSGDGASAQSSGDAQMQRARACMATALNNTIYKQQSDADLDTALFAQDLGDCPADFIQSFGKLRNAARDLFAVGRELRAHMEQQGRAIEDDRWEFGCRLITGERCTEWPMDTWRSQDAEIRGRFEAAGAALESARRENEDVISRYGLYLTNQPSAPASAPEDANAPVADANASDGAGGAQ